MRRSCVAGIFLLTIYPCLAQTPAAVQGSGIPVPPAQSQPWTPPPTKLSPVVVSAITELFKEGLADPRGCEYREIEIAKTPTWKIKTHGWVLPTTRTQQYAVGWNGVIYPVATVGALCDDKKDFGTTVKFRGNANGWPMSDQGSLRANAGLPVQVALLLRLGQADLAEKVWNEGYAGEDDMKVKDPYAEMASVWLGRWFNRAMQAYLAGDNAAALAICQSMSPVKENVEATAASRGLPNPWPDSYSGEHLWQLPILEADAKRRLEEKPYTPVLESGQPSEGADRITALIRDLELVSVHQTMNPGEASVYDDPVVQALIKEGPDAVEPLLKCLIEDDRLTRSRYTQGMWYDGPIIPVYEAAYVALFHILDVSFPVIEKDNADYRQRRDPRHLSPDERKALAAKLRTTWDTIKGKTRNDSAYLALQDDNAGTDAWLHAVDHIVQPADGTITPYKLIPPMAWYHPHVDGSPFTPLGEALRAKENPSVSDLMIKRFGQLLTTPPTDPVTLSKLLLALADWDGKAHLADLRKMAHELDTRFAQQTYGRSVEVNVTLCERRFKLGDETALSDYAAFLESLTVDDWKPNVDMSAYFEMMWDHPDNPAMVVTARKIFAEKDSLWQRLRDHGYSPSADLLKTPMLGVAPFREEIGRELYDQSICGTATIYENGNVEVKRNNSTTQEPSIRCDLDPLAPASGTEVKYRLCDYIAFRLSKIDGFPACQPYWPKAKRQEAVAACRVILHQYGDNCRQRAGDPAFDNSFINVVQMHFSKLDHPATPNDVKQGRAIFSLSGRVRLCHLPDFPVSAWRPGRKTDPQPGTTSYPDGTHKATTLYTTAGRVWQAEEVEVDGKWERYYGFVGRYQIEKVPAAELRFLYEGADGNITKEINGTLEGPSDFDRSQFNLDYAVHTFHQLGLPLPVKITVMNGSGHDEAMPAGLTLPVDAGKALPAGMSLELSYTDKIPPKIARFSEPEFKFGTWHDLPLRKEVRLVENKVPGPTLSPAQNYDVLAIDLRDFFDMSRPGTYRLKADFHVPGEKAGTSNEVTFSVAEKASD